VLYTNKFSSIASCGVALKAANGEHKARNNNALN